MIAQAHKDRRNVVDSPGSSLAARAGIDKSDERVRRMFASIAPRYDLLNHLLSLNIDRSWRTFTTRVVAPVAGIPILDCCTGTADLALAYDAAGRGQSPIVATDFCREMLALGHSKVQQAGAAGRITLVEGDTQRLPLPSDTFGVVSVAFGLRNVRDTVRGVDELLRVARPGGKIAILSFPVRRDDCWAGCTWASFAICCHASARRCAPIRTARTTIYPRACSNSRTARRCSISWPRADSLRSSNIP